MRPRIVRVVSCCVLLGSIGSTSASADPIQITGGTFTTAVFSSSFTITGEQGLSLSGGGDAAVSTLFLNCKPCNDARPEMLDFNASVVGGVYSGDPGAFAGVTYERTAMLGNFSFTGAAFDSAILSLSNLTITAPFSMTGTLSNYARNPTFSTDPPLFTVSLYGFGTATARFTALPNGDGLGNTLFDITSLTYEFDAAPAPTPEPASLLLLGTGLMALVARRRRTGV